MNLYAEIIVNSEALEIDRPFTYKVPEEFKSDIKVGQIVKVPFGKGNKTSEGFVLTVKNEEEVDIKFRTKNISTILVKEPVIDADNIKLIDFLRKKTLCKYIDAFRLLIPVGIMKGAKNKSKKVIVLKSEDLSSIQKPDGYKDIIEFLNEIDPSFINKVLSKNDVIDYILEQGKDKRIKQWILNRR